MKRVLLVVALLGAVMATPSSATTYYDYWGYWHKPPGATTWQYSKVGPGGYYLQQGTQVEGWRFAMGTASQNDPKPRPTAVAYDDYCNGHDTGAAYRVLLVVDYGTQSGAPSGPVYSCYGFSSQESGETVLRKEHLPRESGGLICGIDGYPKSGCGEVVSSPAPKPTQTKPATTQPRATQPATSPRTSTGGGSTTTTTSSAPVPPDATAKPRTSTAPSTAPTAQATDDVAASTPSAEPVAKQFVPPHRRGGVPLGFVLASAFVVALIGGVLWQRRRRAG